ncbi:hypothetical protein BX666DRAFT_1948099 [Dichotomocladium elegans]|nr:hypothetical protein BX666DRAFT_1948099 [Dichotomocladium elegans]
MDNWAMNENGDPTVGTVNNVQLLWKLQALQQSLGIPLDHNESMEQSQDFAASLSADNGSFVDGDLAQEVDDLLNMQDTLKQASSSDYSFLSNNAFSLPPPSSQYGIQSFQQTPQLAVVSTTVPATPTMTVAPRKRSRSPSYSDSQEKRRTPSERSYEQPALNSPSFFPPPDKRFVFFPQPVPPPPVPVDVQAEHDTQLSIPASEDKDSPRPCLRLHIQKDDSAAHVLHENTRKEQVNEDPMRHRLDVNVIRRLSLAILRRLGITMALNELPEVDISQYTTEDSQHLLPQKAMEVITTMILGTSGDRDVKKTGNSQISNGDLVAVQQMVIAALLHKGISISTILPKPTLVASSIPEYESAAENMDEHGEGYVPGPLFVDLTEVHYDMPVNMTRLFLRLYRFILNMLLATPDCWPFVQPVPETAVLYHKEIKEPMDLSTVERKMWNGVYTTFSRFEEDIQLIWQNAKSFHRNTGTIPKHADNLDNLFKKIVRQLKKQILFGPAQRSPGHSGIYFDPLKPLPEEVDLSKALLSRLFSRNSTVYTIYSMSSSDSRVKMHGLSHEKLLYLQLNSPFFEAVRRMKENPEADHSVIPRFFIAKNRTFLEQVSSHGVLAIFHNVLVKRTEPGQYEVETDVVVAYPGSPLYNIDLLNQVTDEQSPRAYIYLRPLRVLQNIKLQINQTVERDYFKRLNTTSKITPISQAANVNEDIETKVILWRIAHTVLSLPFDKKSENQLRERHQYNKDRRWTTRKSPSTPARLKAENSSPSKSQDTTIRIPTSTLASVTQEAKFKHAELAQSSPDLSEAIATHSTPTTSSNTPSIQHEPVSHTTPTTATVSKSSNNSSPLTSVQSDPNSNREMDTDVWRRLFKECHNKGVRIEKISERYKDYSWSVPNNDVIPNSEGYFKQVYFLDNVVVQKFRGMSMYQRITEVACLMKLKNLPHMAQLVEVLYNDEGDVVGLSLERYQQTLKQYAHVHSHHRLTAHQKYDIICQMIECMKVIHEAGLAHRDLSEVNFMVNKLGEKLEDGSDRVMVYMIDFGKSVFCNAEDVREWFVDVPRAANEYDGDVVPENKSQLDEWCQNLPWIKAKPDHGYRMYRSIQTLPKTRSHTQVLEWLIQPMAEDMYSIGVMIWKLFSETEPWRGILDSDLQGLRYAAEDDYRIERALERDVQGRTSRELLLKCIKVHPRDRVTAGDLLSWIQQDSVKKALLEEWKTFSSETRSSRKAKVMYGFEEPDSVAPTRVKRRKGNHNNNNNNNNNNNSSTASSSSGRPQQQHQQKPKSPPLPLLSSHPPPPTPSLARPPPLPAHSASHLFGGH